MVNHKSSFINTTSTTDGILMKKILFFTLLFCQTYASEYAKYFEIEPDKTCINSDKNVIFPTGSPVLAAAISPDGSKYAFATEKGFFVNDMHNATQEPQELNFMKWYHTQKHLFDPKAIGFHLLFTQDNSRVIAYQNDRNVYIWDFNENKQLPCVRTTKNVTCMKNNLLATFDLRFFAITDIKNQSLYTGRYKTSHPSENYGYAPQAAEWSPDGTHLLIASNSNNNHSDLFLINTSALLFNHENDADVTEKKINCNVLNNEEIYSIAWSPNSSMFAVLSASALTLFDIRGKQHYKFQPITPISSENKITFNGDGTRCFFSHLPHNSKITIINIIKDNEGARYAANNVTININGLNSAIKTMFTPCGSILIVLKKESENTHTLSGYDSTRGTLLHFLCIENMQEPVQLQCDETGKNVFTLHKRSILRHLLPIIEPAPFDPTSPLIEEFTPTTGYRFYLPFIVGGILAIISPIIYKIYQS